MQVSLSLRPCQHVHRPRPCPLSAGTTLTSQHTLNLKSYDSEIGPTLSTNTRLASTTNQAVEAPRPPRWGAGPLRVVAVAAGEGASSKESNDTWSGSGGAPLIEMLRKAAQTRTLRFGPACWERAAEWSVTHRGPGGGHCSWNLAVRQAGMHAGSQSLRVVPGKNQFLLRAMRPH